MKIAMVDISRATAAHYKIPHSVLMGDKRNFKTSHPRMLAMVLCREYTHRTFPQIGNYFGRDHTTVIHAIKNMGPASEAGIAVAADRDVIVGMFTTIATARQEREQAWVADLLAGKASWLREPCEPVVPPANDSDLAPHGLNIFKLVTRRKCQVLVPVPRRHQLPPSMFGPVPEHLKMRGGVMGKRHPTKPRVKRSRPVKPGKAYSEIWRIVDGCVLDTINAHPNYISPAMRKAARVSLNKRITGAITTYAAKAAKSPVTNESVAARVGDRAATGCGDVHPRPKPPVHRGGFDAGSELGPRLLSVGGVTPMSIRLMTAVWDSGAYEGGTLLVLLAMADWAQDDGTRVFPKMETLAAKARLSVRGAQMCVASLRDDGTIVEVAPARRGRATEYKIVLSALKKLHRNDCAATVSGEVDVTNGVQSSTVGVQSVASHIDNHQEPSIEPSLSRVKNSWPKVWRAFKSWPWGPVGPSEQLARASWLRMAGELPEDIVARIIAHGDALRAENARRGRAGPVLAIHPHNWLERDRGWEFGSDVETVDAETIVANKDKADRLFRRGKYAEVMA